MASEIYRIDIQLSANVQLIPKIPERMEVPQGAVVQWNLMVPKDDLDSFFIRRSVIFTLYFSNLSPFAWKRQFVQTPLRLFPIRSPRILRLAEDVADVKGDYKYGVNAVDGNSGEQLFDDDPLLIVY